MDSTIKTQLDLQRVAEAFVAPSILFGLVKLRVFRTLGVETRDRAAVAAELHVSEDYLSRLLEAGVAAGFLESPDNHQFRVADRWTSILADEGRVEFLGDWLQFMSHWYCALGQVSDVVATGQPVPDSILYEDDPEAMHRHTLAMHNYAALRGAELVRYLDTRGSRSVLDVGCGPGTYGFLLGEANPELHVYLLDLPEVLATARQVEARYDLPNRVSYIECDVVTETPEGEFDLIFVSNMLHTIGPQASQDLLRRLYPLTSSGGSIVVQAQFLPEGPTRFHWPRFLDLALMCVTPNGANHSVAETKDWLLDAGFVRPKYQRMSLLNTNSFIRAYSD